jgi:hypothetical protein
MRGEDLQLKRYLSLYAIATNIEVAKNAFLLLFLYTRAYRAVSLTFQRSYARLSSPPAWLRSGPSSAAM